MIPSMMHRSPARVCLLLFAFLGTTACDRAPRNDATTAPQGTGGSSSPRSGASAPTAAANVSGFDPQDLHSICSALAAGPNPWFGTRILGTLEKQNSALSLDDSSQEAVQVRQELGFHRLRLGHAEQAVTLLRDAWDRLRISAVRPPEANGLLLQLAISELRLAENQNCIDRHCRGSCIFPIEADAVHMKREPAQAAAAHLIEFMKLGRHDPSEQFTAIWLLNLAQMTLGEWPDAVPEKLRLPAKALESTAPAPRFVDVAPKLNLNAFSTSGGAAVEDFDGDDLLDVITSASDPCERLLFFRNAGDGTFDERGEAAGMKEQLGGLNLSHADYDNDGRPDLLVMRGAWMADDGRQRLALLHNLGGGRFEDVTRAAGLAEPARPTQSCAWLDYDLDGDLDFYLAGETGTAPQYPRVPAGDVRNPGALFRNNGDGTFTDVAAAAGVTNDRFCKAVAAGDYDNDGWCDLYASNLGQPNRLYRNNRDGTFADVTEAAGVAEPIYSFPTFFFDCDADGWLDLFVGAYEGDVGMLCAEYLGLGDRVRAARMKLYHNQRDGTFRDVTKEAGLFRLAFAMSANYGDIDNDGRPDFYLGTGAPSFDSLVPNLMFLNRGDGTFADVTAVTRLGHLQKGHGIAFGDLDNDGDQDIYHQLGGFFPGDRYGNALFLNPGMGRNWITLFLVGSRDNRFGVGARIKITIREQGVARQICTVVGTGGSFGSSSLRQEIGLGSAEQIESLEVYWPAARQSQRWEKLPVNRAIELTQGQAEFRERPLKRVPISPD